MGVVSSPSSGGSFLGCRTFVDALMFPPWMIDAVLGVLSDCDDDGGVSGDGFNGDGGGEGFDNSNFPG